ncbi:MAG: serine acetyltransferase [Enterobacterales bacterium endosymbiont of Blomia tropicalis]|uniref:serine acetyltransferase n=1 Tax=Mixta mediterraneensis TaxID=2758443 RepID=UPI0025A7A8D1|nr:serine acetyltransferase [Mixta mediterraneensis]MDL4914489.1 serine acetyltransferase [Mixta mediterraneensis]
MLDIRIYYSALRFLSRHNSDVLKQYWLKEVTRKEKFSWIDLPKRIKGRRKYFLFWWRLANEMYATGNKSEKKNAKRINSRLKDRFGVEIMLGAKIGKGLHIPHLNGIVITDILIAGENLTILQNATIGKRYRYQEGCIRIGNNVTIGAGSHIIGNDLKIGDDVTVGAASIVLNDIPSDTTYFIKVQPYMRSNNAKSHGDMINDAG